MQSADFFRADNPEGLEARNEVIARLSVLCLINLSSEVWKKNDNPCIL